VGTRGRPTMADVAELAGVSLSTVSLTYSGAGPITEETKARVERAAAELGYLGPSALAKSLRSGRTHIVGFVLAESLSIAFRNTSGLQVMDGVVSRLGELGFGILLLPSPTGDPNEHTLLETAPIDAAIIYRVRDVDDPALEILTRRGVPAVTMEGPAPKGGGVVTIDDETATFELIEHLRKLGHERIGTITLPFDINGETAVIDPSRVSEAMWGPTRNRLAAFARAGIEPCVVVECRATMAEEGLAAGHLALAHESKPTALVCQSDLIAVGAIAAARELGLHVPQDVSITGFDGLDLPWIAPLELTTVTQDAVAKGRALADQVQILLQGETPEPINLPLSLRFGNSTARPPR
jgi:DNA-binding LacI/PurR family transcriptional regulator